MTGRINIATVLIRADRAWAMDNAADAMPHDHMSALIRAVETYIGTSAVDGLRADLANTKALLGRVVRVINGSWTATGNHVEQVAEAMKVLRRIEQVLTHLNDDQKGAA